MNSNKEAWCEIVIVCFTAAFQLLLLLSVWMCLPMFCLCVISFPNLAVIQHLSQRQCFETVLNLGKYNYFLNMAVTKWPENTFLCWCVLQFV